MAPTIPPLTRAQLAHVRSLLQDKRARQADGAFVVEGAKAVRDLLALHSRLVLSLVTTPEYRRSENPADRRLRESVTCPIRSCSESSFASLSDVESPQGILAIVRQPLWKEEAIFAQSSMFGIYGERIQDPLNVGTMIRTAAALNVTALWLTADSADQYHPKTVRATGGALIMLPVFSVRDVDEFVRRGCSVYTAEAGSPEAMTLDTIRQVPQRLVLAVGNEGQGLSSSTRKQAACRFTIPLSRRMESLNVASTVAIAAYYLGSLPKAAPANTDVSTV
ncbi:MAG TPA: RNA methyltransferase [Nitrospira sp.]